MLPSRTPARGEVRLCGRAEELHHNNTLRHSPTYHKTLVHLHLLFPASPLPVVPALALWLLCTTTQFFVLFILYPNSIATRSPIRQLANSRGVPTTVTIATLQVLGAHHHKRLLCHRTTATPHRAHAN